MKGFLVSVLLLFFFFLFGEAEDLIFGRFLDELYFGVVPVCDVLFVEDLTV